MSKARECEISVQILYQGNQITIYYAVNSWNFTRLGKAQGLSQAELKEILSFSTYSCVMPTEPIQ